MSNVSEKRRIVEDFLKIKKYLGLPDDLELHLKFDTNEGFYRSNIPAVMIGLRDGYWRKLLIHECLHASGLNHYDKPDFGGSVSYDKYSEKIDKKIFDY